MNYITLHWTILYCIELYYTALYYIILHWTILYCIVLYKILHCTILYCIVLYYTALYYIILHWTIFSYICWTSCFACESCDKVVYFVCDTVYNVQSKQLKYLSWFCHIVCDTYNTLLFHCVTKLLRNLWYCICTFGFINILHLCCLILYATIKLPFFKKLSIWSYRFFYKCKQSFYII